MIPPLVINKLVHSLTETESMCPCFLSLLGSVCPSLCQPSDTDKKQKTSREAAAFPPIMLTSLSHAINYINKVM